LDLAMPGGAKLFDYDVLSFSLFGEMRGKDS
jgi:hypothetical protein